MSSPVERVLRMLYDAARAHCVCGGLTQIGLEHRFGEDWRPAPAGRGCLSCETFNEFRADRRLQAGRICG
ncbi:MAG: hypothetical protein GY715_05805 [Planctomycetes bacterium]|nr:hypothetical protein [Planctomycetota bacterium]